MNSKHYCIACNTDYMTADKLRSHRTYMRNKGKIEGHELKVGESMVGSVKGSQVDPKEGKKMNDFLAPGLVPTKDAILLDEKDLGMYNSDEDIAGNDGTPDVSKNKVQAFLDYNEINAHGAEVPKISVSSS